MSEPCSHEGREFGEPCASCGMVPAVAAAESVIHIFDPLGRHGFQGMNKDDYMAELASRQDAD